MINLEQDIIALLNKYSEENTSNNSDFIGDTQSVGGFIIFVSFIPFIN